MKYYILRWLVCWAYFVDGIIGIISLGFLWPCIGLHTEQAFLNEAEKKQ